MKSKEYLKSQIEQLNIPSGAIVLMHTSLRAVGKVEGGAEALLSLLIDNVSSRGGILCIPTHTWNNLDKECLTLDLSKRETCLGALPTVALREPHGIRSHSPSHSVVAFGNADRITKLFENELSVKTPTSPEGFYGKLLSEHGYVLLVGVGHNSNTFLHMVEEACRMPHRVAEHPTRVSTGFSDGRVEYRDMYMFDESIHGDVSHKFYMYEPAFRYYGAISDGMIGDAPTQLCSCEMMSKAIGIMSARAASRDPLVYGGVIPDWLYKM